MLGSGLTQKVFMGTFAGIADSPQSEIQAIGKSIGGLGANANLRPDGQTVTFAAGVRLYSLTVRARSSNTNNVTAGAANRIEITMSDGSVFRLLTNEIYSWSVARGQDAGINVPVSVDCVGTAVAAVIWTQG